VIEISSLQNPRIKSTAKLMNRRERDATGRFLIEGAREVQRALTRGFPLETLFFCEALLTPEGRTLIKKAPETIACTEPVFRKISYRESPDGILAIGIQVHKGLSDLVLSSNPLLLIAEGVEKPGNLGTILRTCDAAGADCLILADKLTDIYNPNVVRSSVGTLFSVPIIETEGRELISYLKKHAIKIYAATPEAAIVYTECDFKSGTAIVVGTEHAGLSSLWKEEADSRLFIPMRGLADSLNVSAAAGILLYEALRQRSL
jgi:RNA methyltransferase, TrmH family